MTCNKDNSLFYSKLDGDTDKILYMGGANIVKHSLEDNSQRILKSQESGNSQHTPLVFLCQNTHGTLLASVQTGKNPWISVWDPENEKVINRFKADVDNVRCMSFSSDSGLLCVVGTEEHGKTKMVVWDISALHQGVQPSCLATQLGD